SVTDDGPGLQPKRGSVTWKSQVPAGTAPAPGLATRRSGAAHALAVPVGTTTSWEGVGWPCTRNSAKVKGTSSTALTPGATSTSGRSAGSVVPKNAPYCVGQRFAMTVSRPGSGCTVVAEP